MARLAISLTALALTGLAGCTTYYETPPPAGPVTTTSGAPVLSASARAPVVVAPAPLTAPYRTGFGIVESIGLVNLPPAGWSASAGATGSVAPGPYRIIVRMDDGSIQTLIQDTRMFQVGDRVQLYADGRLMRP